MTGKGLALLTGLCLAVFTALFVVAGRSNRLANEAYEKCKVTGKTIHDTVIDVTPIVKPGFGRDPASVSYFIKTQSGRLLKLNYYEDIRLGKSHAFRYDCRGHLLSIQVEEAPTS